MKERSAASYEGTGWKVYKGERPIALMGNIAYKIDTQAIATHLTEKEVHFLELGLQMDFKIGAIDISASREEIDMTEYTIKAIAARIKLANKEMVATATKAIEGAESFFAATYAYGLLPDDVRKSVQLEFQGKPIVHGFFNNWKEAVYVAYHWKDYKDKFKRRNENCITPTKTYWLADCTNVRARVKKLIAEQMQLNSANNEVYVIDGNGKKGVIEEWAKNNGINLGLFKRLSTIEVPKREKNTDQSEARKQVRGVNIWVACAGHRRHVKLSDCVTPCEIGEIYDCYAIAEDRAINDYSYASFGNRASQLKEVVGEYRVAVIRRNKLGDMNVPAFSAFAKNKLEEKLRETGACKTVTVNIPYHLERNASEIRKALPGHDLAKLLRDQRENPNASLIQTAEHFGLRVEGRENPLVALKEAVLKRYPILKDLGYNTSAEAIVETVKAIDAYQSVKDADAIVSQSSFASDGQLVAA